MAFVDALRVLRPVFDEIAHGITVIDAAAPDEPLILVNKAFERMTGYPRDEVLGRNCRFLQGRDTDPRAVAAVRAAIAEVRACHVCLRNYRKDGTAFLNELKVLPVFGGNGRPSHWVGLQDDVTALLVARVLRDQLGSQAATKPAFQVEHLGFSLAVEAGAGLPSPAADLAVLVTDHRGQVRHANRLASKLVGQPAEAIRSRTLFDLVDADWLFDALAPGAVAEHEWYPAHLQAVGGAKPVELSAYRVVLELGAKPYFVVLARTPGAPLT